MHKNRAFIIAALVAPFVCWGLSELALVFANHMGCSMGFKSMVPCKVFGSDISWPLWIAHFGGSFLIFILGPLAIFVATSTVMYRLTGGR